MYCLKTVNRLFGEESLTWELVLFFLILCALPKEMKDSLPDRHTLGSVEVLNFHMPQSIFQS